MFPIYSFLNILILVIQAVREEFFRTVGIHKKTPPSDFSESSTVSPFTWDPLNPACVGDSSWSLKASDDDTVYQRLITLAKDAGLEDQWKSDMITAVVHMNSRLSSTYLTNNIVKRAQTKALTEIRPWVSDSAYWMGVY